jgi:hypothetical protein
MVTLRTAEAVFEKLTNALGGLEPVRVLTGRRDVRVVSNWKQRGFPPDTYWVVSMELKKRGFKVDPKVFGIAPHLVPEDV